MSVRFKTFAATSSAARADTVVLPRNNNTQWLIRQLYAIAGNASDYVYAYVAREVGKTVTNAAALATATTINLTGDTGVKNTLNGIAVAAADFVILVTNGDVILFEISSVDASGANGVITIDGITFYDGVSNIGTAAAAGNVAWVVWAEDRVALPVGSLNTATLQRHPDAFAGELGQPLGLSSLGAAAAFHAISGVAEAVPVGGLIGSDA